MSDDAFEIIVARVKVLARKFWLTLLDQPLTISAGDSMKIPNSVAPLTIYFERLESEPDPRRLAQLNRRSRERKERRQIPGTIQFCAALLVSSNHK